MLKLVEIEKLVQADHRPDKVGPGQSLVRRLPTLLFQPSPQLRQLPFREPPRQAPSRERLESLVIAWHFS